MSRDSLVPAPLQQLPWSVLFLILAIGGFGLVVLYSASGNSLTVVINQAERRNREVQRLERIQCQHNSRRPEPDRPLGMPQSEPQNPQIRTCQSPKSK